jgi:hypothetical protein
MHNPVIRRLISLTGATVLLACGTTGPPDLAIRVTLDRGVLVRGDTMTVTVTATNVGARTITLVGSSSCLLEFEVWRGPELVQDPSARLCTMDLLLLPLSPGETEVRHFKWRGTGTDGQALAPGSYEVRGISRLEGSGPVASPMVVLEIG